MVTIDKQNQMSRENTGENTKTGAKSKKARLSVTIPKWVKESMGKWVDCEQFPSESEFTGIGLTYFLFVLEHESQRNSCVSHNDIIVLQQQIKEIQKTLETIVQNQKK